MEITRQEPHGIGRWCHVFTRDGFEVPRVMRANASEGWIEIAPIGACTCPDEAPLPGHVATCPRSAVERIEGVFFVAAEFGFGEWFPVDSHPSVRT